MELRSMVSPTGGQPPPFPPMFGQGSLYKLTLDEFQSHLSDFEKPLNAMNLDELVNTVIAVEQQIHAPASSSSSSSNIVPHLPGNNNMNGSCKTIDDVLQEIVQQGKEDSIDRPATCGQITLEDLFVRAGVIDFGGRAGARVERDTQPLMAVDPLVQQQAEWLQYHEQQEQHMELIGSGLQVFGNSIVNARYGESHQMAMPGVSMDMVMPASSDSQMTIETKRPDETVDKNIERRQKRMIKNRESAARSRAKKQAYINRLEDEVRELEDKNMRLKKQKEAEMKALSDQKTLISRYQLRRTSSAPF